MKNIAILAGAAAMMLSAPAFAANPQAIIVNGSVTPLCAINATTAVVSVSNQLADSATGFARLNVAADVATALNTAGITAWCTGATNGVVLSRTALTKGNGLVDGSGFANGVVYDLDLTIPGAIRADSVAPGGVKFEGTSDGAGNGPGVGLGSFTSVDSFGATGSGAPVTFSTEGSSTSGAITVNNVSGATSGFTVNNANRLAAGAYTSTVTLTLTPGV